MIACCRSHGSTRRICWAKATGSVWYCVNPSEGDPRVSRCRASRYAFASFSEYLFGAGNVGIQLLFSHPAEQGVQIDPGPAVTHLPSDVVQGLPPCLLVMQLALVIGGPFEADQRLNAGFPLGEARIKSASFPLLTPGFDFGTVLFAVERE